MGKFFEKIRDMLTEDVPEVESGSRMKDYAKAEYDLSVFTAPDYRAACRRRLAQIKDLDREEALKLNNELAHLERVAADATQALRDFEKDNPHIHDRRWKDLLDRATAAYENIEAFEAQLDQTLPPEKKN